MEALIQLARVSKVFPCGGRSQVAALDEVSLDVAPRSATLVEGPSGSGKTTLLSLAGCMARPTAGRIRVDGQEVTRMPEEEVAVLRRRQFGFVFQDHYLIRGASALANVMLPALPSAEAGRGLRRRALGLLDRFGLGALAHEKVERLSGGERQRVAIARALVNDPRVVIADEPTAHLDAATASTFVDLVAELQNEGKTVLVASHDPCLHGSDSFTHRIALRQGRLVES